jgi:arginase
MKKISIISAPSNLGLRPAPDGKLSGVTGLPRVLLDNGLVEKLEAEFQAEIPVPPYVRQRDEETFILNPHGIREFSLNLAIEVEKAIRNDYFPLVLGGDCSILLGNLVALKRRGRYGLFFLDGHADFYLPDKKLNDSGVAGMDLAFATGRGAEVLSNIDGQKPLVSEEDVIVFGFRDMEEAKKLKMPKLSETRLNTFNLPNIRRLGIENAVFEGLEIFRKNDLNGFWIHIDADVLDDRIMPAVDSRQPDGLRYEEFVQTLRILLSSNLAIGMNVGILDPDMDPNGEIVMEFTNKLAECFKVYFYLNIFLVALKMIF